MSLEEFSSQIRGEVSIELHDIFQVHHKHFSRRKREKRVTPAEELLISYLILKRFVLSDLDYLSSGMGIGKFDLLDLICRDLKRECQ